MAEAERGNQIGGFHIAMCVPKILDQDFRLDISRDCEREQDVRCQRGNVRLTEPGRELQNLTYRGTCRDATVAIRQSVRARPGSTSPQYSRM